jgi:hypothetical protein
LTITDTSYSITAQAVTATAADGFHTASLAGSTPTGGSFSGSLATPLTGPDGQKTVTVSATVSDTITTTTTTQTLSWTDNQCSGTSTVTASTTTTSDDPRSASASGTTSYVLDVLPPTTTGFGITGDITATQDEVINLVVKDGSALTPYHVNYTAIGPSTLTTDAYGNLGAANPSGSGKDSATHVGPTALATSCSTPGGTYALTVTTQTQDLGGFAFPDITDTKSFNVTGAPLTLSDQTEVVAQFTDGTYGVEACFASTLSGGGKVNTTPGSVHIAAIVNATGGCAAGGSGTMSGIVTTLTIPSGFVFDVTGKSPVAHIFVGKGNFDLHNPAAPFVEVTGFPGVAQTPAPQSLTNTVTIDLSKVNFTSIGGGANGVLPADYTVYIRSHTKYSGSNPSTDVPFLFTTGTNATLSGIGATSNSSSATIIANPTLGVTGKACTADGTL